MNLYRVFKSNGGWKLVEAKDMDKAMRRVRHSTGAREAHPSSWHRQQKQAQS